MADFPPPKTHLIWHKYEITNIIDSIVIFTAVMYKPFTSPKADIDAVRTNDNRAMTNANNQYFAKEVKRDDLLWNTKQRLT